MSTQGSPSATARCAALPSHSARCRQLRRLALGLAAALPAQLATAQAVETHFNRNVPVEADQRMRTYVASGHQLLCVAFPPAGGNRWSIVTDKTFFNRNVPQECHQKMQELHGLGHDILCVAFPPAGGNSWSVITDKTFFNRNIPQECHQKMVDYHNAGHRVLWVAFPPAGGTSWSVITDKTFFNRSVPQECHEKMVELHGQGQRNRCVGFPTAGGNRWTVVTDQSWFNRGVPNELHRVMRAMARCPGGPLRMVAYDPDGDGFTIVSAADPDGLPAASLSVGNETFSLDKLAHELRQRLDGNVVKYAFVVRHGGAIRTGAAGPKRTTYTAPAQDFTIYDRMNPASVGKTVTGVALLHALEKNNVGVDELIWKYLPSFWSIPASVKTITFKQLLRHESGFRTANGYFYADLKTMVENGIALADKVYDYSNLNYALARILLAYVDGYAERGVVDHGAATAQKFIAYVQANLFDPIGAPSVQWRPDAVEPTLFFPDPPGSSTGTAYGDWSLRPGSAGVNASIAELAILLDKLRNSTAILSAGMRSQMDTHLLGWDKKATAHNGHYWSKGGYFPGSMNGGAELHATVMKFDTGVQVAAVINGDLGIGGQVLDAYAAAWTLKTLPIKITAATAKLFNVTTAAIDVSGENLDLVTAAHFGSETITETDSSDPTRAWLRVLSPTRLLVHPPQGLRPGVHQLQLSSGRSLSNPAGVTLERTPQPTLLMPRAVMAGQRYTGIVAAGDAAAAQTWLAFSPTAVPSVLPGIVSLDLGSGFAQVQLWPVPLAIDPIAGCAKLTLPSVATMRGAGLWFQAMYGTRTLPLPVSDLASVTFR